MTPAPNAARKEQIFEIWVRPVPNKARIFTLRCVLRELERLIFEGLSEDDFARSTAFLRKFSRHYAPDTSTRLGYRLDDLFYGLEKPYLETLADRIGSLTRHEVNAALRRHLSHRNLKVVMVTDDAHALKKALLSGAPSRIDYPTAKSKRVTDEDPAIGRYPLAVRSVTIVDGKTVFEGERRVARSSGGSGSGLH